MNQPSSVELFLPTPEQPDKPLMVFLPGMDGTGKLLARQIAGLSQYFDLRCLAIPDSNRQSWEDLAADVIRLIHREHCGRTIYLCSESFGACLALQIAATAPRLLKRLILINPASSLRRQFWARLVSQSTPYMPNWLYGLSGTFVFPLLANFNRINDFWQKTFVETVQPVSQDCFAWRISMLQSFAMSTDQLRQIATPTAMLASDSDRLLPSQQEVQRLKQFLPCAVMYQLPDSGHVCLLEDDVDLTQCLKVLDFLPETLSIKV